MHRIHKLAEMSMEALEDTIEEICKEADGEALDEQELLDMTMCWSTIKNMRKAMHYGTSMSKSTMHETGNSY